MPSPSREEILDRFEYRPPTLETQLLFARARGHVKALAGFLADEVPNSRDRALALTSLEDTLLRVNKAIAVGRPADVAGAEIQDGQPPSPETAGSGSGR